MSEQDAESLKLLLLLGPLMIFAVGLAAFWLDVWMDKRDQQRSTQS